jgi:hypothetical protein
MDQPAQDLYAGVIDSETSGFVLDSISPLTSPGMDPASDRVFLPPNKGQCPLSSRYLIVANEIMMAIQ